MGVDRAQWMSRPEVGSSSWSRSAAVGQTDDREARHPTPGVPPKSCDRENYCQEEDATAHLHLQLSALLLRDRSLVFLLIVMLVMAVVVMVVAMRVVVMLPMVMAMVLLLLRRSIVLLDLRVSKLLVGPRHLESRARSHVATINIPSFVPFAPPH